MAYNSFPYVNMHELNLDYLLNKSKEVQANVEASAGSASSAASSAAAAANSANASLTYSRNSANSAASAEASAADSAESARIAVAAAGDPVTFTAASQLTNTSKIYVYIGETGTYTYGHWYYYANGSWIDGGVYGTWTTDDKLDHDSVNAVQNKVITAAVDDLNSDVEDLNSDFADGVVKSDITNVTWMDAWINVSGNIRSSNASKTALVRLNKGQTIVVGTQNANVTVIGATDADTIAIGDNVTVIATTSSGAQFEEYSYTASSDSNVVICVSKSNYEAYINTETSFALKREVNPELFTESSQELAQGSINTATGSDSTDERSLRTQGYINQSAIKLTFGNCLVRFFAYTADNVYVGMYSATDGITTDWKKATRLSSPVYLADIDNGNNYNYRLVFDRFNGSVTADNANVKLMVGNLDALSSRIDDIDRKFNEEYTVGTDGDFETFTEMLVALKDNTNQKTVYVKSGTYDIFTEMGGADFMASVDTSKNWREVNNVVPPNTTIIGIGKVVLAWNPTDSQIIDQAHAHLFSPLNLSGTYKIVNISVECSNCRYGIHDETSGRAEFDGSTHILDRVNVNYVSSTYGTHYAYGAGHNKSCTYHYKNCKFLAAYAAPWSMHDWPASADEPSSITFDNCVFMDNRNSAAANIRLSSSDQAGRLDAVNINGCYFNTVSFSTEGSSDVKQGYHVTSILCNSFTPVYSSHILEADRIAPEEYLTI